MTHCPAFAAQPPGAPHRSRLMALLPALFSRAILSCGVFSCAVCSCAASFAQPAGARALPAVVVWDFDNQTPAAAAQAERTEFLKRALSENLTAVLLQVAGLPVVERQRLKDLLAEQKVSASELADENSRVRLGKIIGATRMVFGGFFVLGDEVQVHVRLVDTATARVLFSDEVALPVSAVMQDVAPLNRRLAQALAGATSGTGSGTGSSPSSATSNGLASLPRSYPATLWQAYDQALALADGGQLDRAVQALQNLLTQHQDFTPAERQLVALLDRMARR